MKITGYRFDVYREPLSRPFSFKGGAFREKWITITSLEDEAGNRETGIGGLAVLWSDPDVFYSRSETGGNLALSLIAEEAARLIIGEEIISPLNTVPSLAEKLETYAKAVTGRHFPRKTLIFNCLVSLDLALWKLLARRAGTEDLADLLPSEFKTILPEKHHQIGRIPLADYGMKPEAAVALADAGCFLFKIKIGFPGEQKDMLLQDIKRLTSMHEALKNKKTEKTRNERILYYLDANGRYENENTLLRLLEHADSIGMLSRVVILEEPYPEDRDISVAELPVRVAADESVHGPEDIPKKADLGYGAFAVKPAGKTLSVSLLTIRAAAAAGLPCFVADSACVPLLVEWNKNIATRLPVLPEMMHAVFESNGEEHYGRWSEMLEEHPAAGMPWINPVRGFYETGDDFFRCSGGVFRPYSRYGNLYSEGS